MMNSSEAVDAIVEGTLRSRELICRVGLRVPIPWIPEYVELRDWYYSKPRWLRWLFFLEKRKLEILTRRQQQKYIVAVLRAGEVALER